MHSSTEVLSNLFLIHNFILYSYLCDDNCLIFFSSLPRYYYYYYLIIINILCVSSKHVKPCKS